MRAGAERQVRGERLVEKVLEATLCELAANGYAAVSIDAIAARAAVARTTIYRRWPTKADVVLEALGRVADDFLPVGGSGALGSDLLAMLKGFRDFAATTRGECLMRMVLAEGVSSEISQLARKIRKAKEAAPQLLIAGAVKRGELPRGTDPKLLVDVLFAAVQYSLIFMNEAVEDRKLAQIVDLVLTGAASSGGLPARVGLGLSVAKGFRRRSSCSQRR